MAAWKAEQARVRGAMRAEPLGEVPEVVAGADCAFTQDEVVAAAVRFDVRRREVVEVVSVRRPLTVPYIPGFLAFREAPAVVAALSKLAGGFGAVLIDGAGFAHPRRAGLAVHVGVELDLPTLGVAKSRLLGTHDEPGEAAGSAVDLTDKGEVIGRVLRLRDRVRPLFVSVGHGITLDDAQRLTLACGVGYRLPEPTRQADAEVARAKKALG